MMFVILDLEWNTAFCSRSEKYLNEIIEFGAVKLDGDCNVLDKFSMLVKPQVGKSVSDLVLKLTHITDEDLSGADTFTQVLSRFEKFAEGCTLLAWGPMDVLTLVSNCEYFLKDIRLDFTDRFVDLQKYCERCFNYKKSAKQIGLIKAAKALAIAFDEESLHRALNDSILEAECFKKLYLSKNYRPLFEDFVQIMNEEFYKKLLFKTQPITELDDPLIEKDQLHMHCKKCGKLLLQKTPWALVHNAFRARFTCGDCNMEFEANARFRLKYEGVVCNKYMRKITEEESKAKAQE